MKTYHDNITLCTKQEAIKFAQEWAHGDIKAHDPEVKDRWDYYHDDDEERPPASERWEIRAECKRSNSDSSDWMSEEFSIHPTEEEAEKALKPLIEEARNHAASLMELTLPDNLDPQALEIEVEYEKRDGFAYTSRCTVTYPSPNPLCDELLESSYLGISHDVDGHRLGFATENLQAAIDNLSGHLDSWEYETNPDDPEETIPLKLRACYVGNQEATFSEE